MKMIFEEIVETFINEGSEHSMNALVTHAKENTLSENEIARLAHRMAESGTVMNFRESYKCVDIPSTGGPSSLSTILCPLFIVLLGYRVPKLAVPGRPAGGIDIMAQIPDYRTSIGQNEINEILDECGYAHFLATDNFAPRDGTFYAYRKRIGAINMPELAIASLLSKKVAVGLRRIGLDIRVAPQGNFGSSWDEAKAYAQKFIRTAKLLGIKATCFLTNGMVPYQPYIGRREALTALNHVLEDSCDEWLQKHVMTCFAMAKTVTNTDKTIDCLSHENLKQVFSAHLQAQGTDYERFLARVNEVRSFARETIYANRDGFIIVDLLSLRNGIVKAQNKFSTSHLFFPDPMGIILLKNTGDYVKKGEPIATVRYHSELKDFTIGDIIRYVSRISNNKQIGRYEEVRNA